MSRLRARATRTTVARSTAISSRYIGLTGVASADKEAEGCVVGATDGCDGRERGAAQPVRTVATPAQHRIERNRYRMVALLAVELKCISWHGFSTRADGASLKICASEEFLDIFSSKHGLKTRATATQLS